MKLDDFDLSLRWPPELFLWEGKRVLDQYQVDNATPTFTGMVALLIAEAFHDGDLAVVLEQRNFGSWATADLNSHDEARNTLKALIDKPEKLRPSVEPQYWIERKGLTTKVAGGRTLAVEFHDLINELSNTGYFPKAFPEDCVDISGYPVEKVSHHIRTAIHADVNWPEDFINDSIEPDVLFAVIEYFHDQSQRPRSRQYHAQYECGWHYNEHNRKSGGVVYRWRVNQLLEAHDIGMRLGNKGEETGRLIRYSNFDLDGLEVTLESEPADSEDEKVADAIRMYRARNSTVIQRRAAIAVLAGFLEKHRDEFKAAQLTKGDEGTLFEIFNTFAIRHNKKAEKQEYGDEYLDWIYWVTLAGIQLIKGLNEREA